MVTQPVSQDDHRHGMYALSPLALLVMSIVCALAYWIFSMLQITSTEQTIYGLLSVGVQLTPGLTGGQVFQYTKGTLDHNQVIAAAIGWGVQVALLMLSFPPDSALLRLHRKHNDQVAPSLAKQANAWGKARMFLMGVLIGGDILTDFLYVANGHSFVGLSGTTIGVLLVAIVYPTAICFVTVFVGKYLFAYIDALFGKLRLFPISTPSASATKKPESTGVTMKYER